MNYFYVSTIEKPIQNVAVEDINRKREVI